METSTLFRLGTFSYAGCPPFVGLVLGNHVIAVTGAYKYFQQLARNQSFRLSDTVSLLAILADWQENLKTLERIAHFIKEQDEDVLRSKGLLVELNSLKRHAPILLPRQIFCAGANYPQHVKEMRKGLGGQGSENRGPVKSIRKELKDRKPYVFIRSPGTVNGPDDDIPVSPPGKQHDWEIELAVIIGKETNNATIENAFDAVAGYTVCNDVTTRECIFREDIPALRSDWFAAKNRRGYFPLGPYFVPKSFIANPYALRLKLSVNGERKQDCMTGEMIHNIEKLIVYISSITTLFPGDVIATGSPHGNGVHWGKFLSDNDIITAEIAPMGTQHNRVILSS